MKGKLLAAVCGSLCPLAAAVNPLQALTYLYRAISAERERHENVVFSPYSILTHLSMTQEASKMSTREEMEKLLPSKESLDLGSLDEPDPEGGIRVTVQSVSLTYAPKYMERDPVFSLFAERHKTFEGCKGCYLKTVDFSNPTTAAQGINSFVGERTGGHFLKIVDASELSESTQMLLANAFVFQAPWLAPFNLETEEDSFRGVTSTGEQSQKVQFLKRLFSKDQYTFEHEPGLKVVCLKYADSRLRFCLFLPDDFQEFQASINLEPNFLERKLMLVAEATPRRKRELILELPQFTLSAENHRLDLVKILKMLGLKKMFTEGFADFSGMTEKREDFFVSTFLHQADFAVTAAGTEGSAYMDVSEPEGFRPMYVRVDKPFFFTVAFVDGSKPPNFLLAGRVVNMEGAL
ncbi:hypothetical protein ACSSS7_000495 [Eimeria intestinalis]